VRFGVGKDVPKAMALGAEAAKEVSKMFPHPVKLEFEKVSGDAAQRRWGQPAAHHRSVYLCCTRCTLLQVYYPYLLMNKKRYAGIYWSKPDHWDKMDTKGIETVRRDNCALVRQVVDTVLRMVLMEHSVEGAISYVKQTIADLLQNKIDLSMLVITKALGEWR